ncbi:hypothetical protein [Variovorax sp. 770b2]|uniref:hypothetical protein n=1 Tax=Variovorax sp. 770b2 TaxID=1566271 RepID=UPI0008E1FD77|nr:hypothetical protein [Variovorax sp. 770b2]SFP51167.1 hypothetical protein SAMN03159339_2819 [Variovorax sp. 770b2]
MTLPAEPELLVLFKRVQKVLPFESTDLRQANVRSTPLDLDELMDHPSEYLAGIAEAALEEKGSFWSDVQLMLERWKSEPSAFDLILGDEGFVAVLTALADLPGQAFQGSLGVSRHLPSKIDDAAAYRCTALLVLISLRSICFGERRGLDQVADFVERKGWRFARLLPDHVGFAISGFRVFYGFTHSLEDADALLDWSRNILSAKQNRYVQVSLLAAIYLLLTTVGRTALANDPEILLRFAR